MDNMILNLNENESIFILVCADKESKEYVEYRIIKENEKIKLVYSHINPYNKNILKIEHTLKKYSFSLTKKELFAVTEEGFVVKLHEVIHFRKE